MPKELILVILSAGALILYHVRLYLRARKTPQDTAIGVGNHARRAWAQSIMDEKRDILAVQTLRNWIMASTFLASTAILISLGLVASAFRTDITASASHALNLFGHPSETLWMLKLLALAALFFYAFFNFTLAIRYYNHACLIVNVPLGKDPAASVACAAEILNHGALHYTLGMRGFYLAIPLGLWLFGPLWMLGGTVLILLVLYRLDREI
jgi:uncharacterized membrane protein